MNIIDISMFQGHIDWHELKASGQVDAVFCKATEGLYTSDDLFFEYHDRAKVVGIPTGAYHFFHGNLDGGAQAHHFLKRISGREGTLLPMVDVEEKSGEWVGRAVYLSNLSKFIKAVDGTLNTGKLMLIYFEYSFWTGFLGGYDGFSGHPAWPAAYNNDADLDMSGTGWKTWTLWQHSDGQHPVQLPPIPGIQNPNVDHDRLNGSDLSVISR